MDRKKWIWVGVIVLLTLTVAGLWFSIHRFLHRPRTARGVHIPVCLLNGDLRNPRHQKSGFENLNSVVRLRFEVNTIDDCKQLCSDYCHARASEGYVPGNLKMTFRQDQLSSVSEKFAITGHCIFEKIIENE